MEITATTATIEKTEARVDPLQTQDALKAKENEQILTEQIPEKPEYSVGPPEEDLSLLEKTIDFSDLIEKVNQYVNSFSTKVTFDYDEEEEKPVIVVLDKETGETIRQIPPKEMLHLLSKLEDITGIIFHGKY